MFLKNVIQVMLTRILCIAKTALAVVIVSASTISTLIPVSQLSAQPFQRETVQLQPVDRLIICTQNVHRFGEKRSKTLERQLYYLTQRFLEARCDIIGIQEVYGKTQSAAWDNLEKLVDELNYQTRNPADDFKGFLGNTRDNFIRNGFIIRKSIGNEIFVRSHGNRLLPKLQALGSNGRHLRDPLAVAIRTRFKSGLGSNEVILYLLNIHLKSKAQNWKDPTSTRYEITRMEMAESIREIVMDDTADLNGNSRSLLSPNVVQIVLGDRNSPPTSASASILRGELILSDFQSPLGCRVAKDLQAACQSPLSRQPLLIDLLNSSTTSPNKNTYRYKGEEEILDEILVASDDLAYFKTKDGVSRVDTMGGFSRGSDHRMVWAEMRR